MPSCISETERARSSPTCNNSAISISLAFIGACNWICAIVVRYSLAQYHSTVRALAGSKVRGLIVRWAVDCHLQLYYRLLGLEWE